MTAKPEATVTLVTTDSEWEATLIADALRASGFDAHAAGGLTAGFRAEAPGRARVEVLASQLAAAEKELALIKAAARDIDWSKVDVTASRKETSNDD